MVALRLRDLNLVKWPNLGGVWVSNVRLRVLMICGSHVGLLRCSVRYMNVNGLRIRWLR